MRAFVFLICVGGGDHHGERARRWVPVCIAGTTAGFSRLADNAGRHLAWQTEIEQIAGKRILLAS